MTPEDITALLKEAAEPFPHIQGKQNNNITLIWEILLPILLTIPYNESVCTHSLIGIIQNVVIYLAKYGVALPVPTRLPSYSADITPEPQ